MNVLVIGYGNPGRLDDGLGPAFAERVVALAIPGVTADADYQLNVEDAADLGHYDAVLFADASVDADAPFALRPLAPAHSGLGFSSHSVSPAALLGLAQSLFGATPRAYLLVIRGYAFDGFGEGLSPQATANLDAAVERVAPLLRAGLADIRER
jgi:hydrogenase maturation protease